MCLQLQNNILFLDFPEIILYGAFLNREFVFNFSTNILEECPRQISTLHCFEKIGA